MTARIRKSMWKTTIVAAAMIMATGCETVQTTQAGAVGVDRTQRMAVSSQEVDQAAGQQYAQVMAEARAKGLLNTNPAHVARVRAIAQRIIPATAAFRPDAVKWGWEANVLTASEVNAWCMPGGKIAVYSGLIEKLQVSDDELAAVMGHEIAHALREHARERVSEQSLAGTAISIGAAVLGVGQGGQQLGEALYQGVLGLPHSRAQETEADRIGVELAARAGYDPRAAITLWQKMGQMGGGDPVKWLSTHPSREDRLRDLTAYSQRVLPLYEQSRRR
ncbi:M48 family metallopeptidase [Noviherbaspirillum galbum]|uniref:M48 family metallopeptidase n=1 Tax=Noviherbaspirillum galbum TaxID=2709383 RepID=A0A6B3ST87_9BURK|nr:M48 family metallopeptidase [Noviherbaspirillum galbum]NEX61622.1 M48 family metallopeptidase [Noviherbaspirillum galbum]